jgi:hypothetical protein
VRVQARDADARRAFEAVELGGGAFEAENLGGEENLVVALF